MTFARAVRAPLAIGIIVLLALTVGAGGTTPALALAAAVLGAVVGLAAAGLYRARYGASGHGVAGHGAARRILEPAALCFAIEGVIVAWGLASSPALYAARFYAKGGVARTLQLVAEGVLGPRGVVLLGFALAVGYVGPRRMPARLRWAALGVLVLLALGFGLAAREPEAPIGGTSSGATSPNVLLVVVEGLRADRIAARTTPTLARLAARGARFDRAYTSTPERLPGWATLLTGRHAHHHGLRSEDPPAAALAHDLDALPARLARAGYATAALGDDGDILRRLDLGFAQVDAPPSLPRDERLARQTALLPLLTSAVGRRFFPGLRGLRETSDPRRLAGVAAGIVHVLRQRPFFLTVSFSTTAAPYVAPGGYAARGTDHGYRGRFRYQQDREAPADDADIAQIRALYDGSVRAVDDGVARLLEVLADEGVAGDTVVVVTSDHGERLFEGGRGQGHDGHLLGDESTHVPLVVFDPRRRAPSRTEGVARDVDVAATLYALTGVSPPADLDGRSLVPLLDQQPDEPRFAFAESGPPAATDDAALRFPASLGLVAHHRMIRDERFKLVYVPARKRIDYALFDSAGDPEERRDILFARPDVVDRLRPALQRWMLADPHARLDDDLLVPGEPPPSDLVWLAAAGPTAALDTLAKRGVRFTHVYPSGRPLLPGQPVLDGWGPSELVVVAPGRLPPGRVVDAPVRDVDLAPTLAELRGLDRDAPPGSRSLVALANREGAGEAEERPIVTERPGVRALLHGHHRLVVREGRAQLFDVDADPEQRRDLAGEDSARVAELRARLAAALANVPVAGSQAAAPRPRVIHLRFVTAGRAHRVSGVVTAVAGTLSMQPVELGPDAVKVTGPRAEIAFVTSAAVAVGFDVVVDPPAADLQWQLYLDDQPWPPAATFGGPYGRLATDLRAGITSDRARDALFAPSPPVLDPRRDLGLFVDRH